MINCNKQINIANFSPVASTEQWPHQYQQSDHGIATGDSHI